MKDNKHDSAHENNQTIKVSENTIVLEKEFKSDSAHRDLITGIKDLNELEFLTCGVEMALKVWDKSLQTCDYTIETHKPLYTMAITGERNDIMIASLGDGDLIVFGLTNKNQLDIVENAHNQTVVQIVSLQKLKNKYFATRCVLGNVNIWSATHHPDRLFTIENIDKDEASYMHETTITHNNNNNDQLGTNQTNSNLSMLHQSSVQASDRDKMIELRYRLQNQSSSTVLCFSNYNEQQILIAIVDLKTRRKNIIKTFKNQRRPTFLFQIDEVNLLIGTEGGKIEHWSIEQEQLVQTIDAHPKSEEGVSSIIQLRSEHYLLWGSQSDLDKNLNKLLATSSQGSAEFRIWLLSQSDNQLAFTPHIRIETSLSTGIKYLLEASETQIVAVDTHKQLKFYEFIDKVKKEEEEKKAAEEEEYSKLLKQLLNKYDADKSGNINYEEFKELVFDFFKAVGITWVVDEEIYQGAFTSSDLDGSGFISKYELKPIVFSLVSAGLLQKQ